MSQSTVSRPILTHPERLDERSADGTADLIVIAARDCFLRFGVQKTSIGDVARLAGFSRATVYKYFKDKTDILDAVMARDSRDYFEQLGREVAHKESLVDLVSEIIIRASGRRSDLWRSSGDPSGAEDDSVNHADEPAARRYAESFPNLYTNRAHFRMAMFIEFIGPYVAAAIESGEVRDDVDVAVASEWICRIILSLGSVPGPYIDPSNPEDVRRFVDEFVFRGLAAKDQAHLAVTDTGRGTKTRRNLPR